MARPGRPESRPLNRSPVWDVLGNVTNQMNDRNCSFIQRSQLTQGRLSFLSDEVCIFKSHISSTVGS